MVILTQPSMKVLPALPDALPESNDYVYFLLQELIPFFSSDQINHQTHFQLGQWANVESNDYAYFLSLELMPLT